ncbi:MAG: hypothetical protein IJ746_03360 [Ruminococcus sp.]|nr:hypothetical protein [Ruminococcus sp.]
MKAKKVFSGVGIVGAAAQIIISVIAIFTELEYHSYGYLKDTAFGADFYTYEYDATRKAADNVDHLGYFVQSAVVFFAIIIAVLGLIEIAYFGIKLSETKNDNDIN